MLTVLVVLIAVVVLLQCVQLWLNFTLKQQLQSGDQGVLKTACETLEKGQARLEAQFKEDMAANRAEGAAQAKAGREELQGVIQGLGELLQRSQENAAKTQTDKLTEFSTRLDGLRTELTGQWTQLGQTNLKRWEEQKATEAQTAAETRAELARTLKIQSETLTAAVARLGETQTLNLKLVAEQQEKSAQAVEKFLAEFRRENSETTRETREALAKWLENLTAALKESHQNTEKAQAARHTAFGNQLEAVTKTTEERLEKIRITLDGQLQALTADSAVQWEKKRQADAAEVKVTRDELTKALETLANSVTKNVNHMATEQRTHLETVTGRVDKLTEGTEKRLEAMRETVEARLKTLQETNALKLDEMRATVDEKLQGTLEKRLGESFTQVSERLEQVHKGLGEMQTLASGVGDLKRVLTNVKTRGTWGEIQLGSLLEQVLSPQQFARNVCPVPGRNEVVEFALKLPGRDEGQEQLWLPIDAKYPNEEYERLVLAQEAADAAAVETAGKLLEGQLKKCARDIAEKYVSPPHTTDFAILFLPTEGLYAEIIRRSELVHALQRDYRVTIAGPTTLTAILSSLQMGFRTLAIQKRSSEVWTVLGQAKTEFGKYGEVLDKVKKKLTEAQNTVEQAGVRSRAIERTLRKVEALPAAEAERDGLAVPTLDLGEELEGSLATV